MKFRKHIISISIIVCSVSLTILSAVVSKKIVKPTYINSAAELNNIRNNLDGYYVINGNISIKDLANEENFDGWEPIGTKEKPFTGKIDFNYYQLKDLYFSASWIHSQYANSDCEQVLIGFLGYSKGTLIHTSFYNPLLPDLSEYNEKEIVYGTACAVNAGYVTSTSVSFVGNGGLISANGKLTFGSVVGINEKQVLVAKSINTIIINCYHDANIGGIIGKSSDESINSYLFKGGYLQVNSYSRNSINIGGIIGFIDSGQVDNCYCGSIYKSNDGFSNIVKEYDVSIEKLIYGGIIGLIGNASNVSIENAYIENDFSTDSKPTESYISGIIGYSLNNSLTVNNSLINCNFLIKSVPNSFNLLCNTDRIFNCKNNYSLTENDSNYNFNTNNVEIIKFSSLSCKKLNWNEKTKTGYWEKTDKGFFLNIL